MTAMIYQKVSICETIPKNHFCFWYTPEVDIKKPFTPTNSKMRSACEQRSEMATMFFKNEILNVPQSLSTNSETMYHGSKSDIAKRFSEHSIKGIPKSLEKSAIIIEMSPLIRAKCSSTASMTCFCDLAVVLYYEIMRLGADYNRVDIIFDRYFHDSLKEDIRGSRGSGSIFAFDGNTDLPTDMVNNFLKNSQNKNNLNEFLAKEIMEMHHGPKLLVATYKNSVLYSSSTEPLDLQEFSIFNCQSKEADQRLIRHTLHCISDLDDYKRIVVRTIDTDVLILLISYISQYHELCENIEIYAEMVNSVCQYDIIGIVRAFGKETCDALPFFYAFTGCDTVSSFFSKDKCRAWDVWQNSE